MFDSEFDSTNRMSLLAKQNALVIPKGRRQHHSYDEEVDASARLIEDETVEVEQEIPAEENEPVESVEANTDSDVAVFEE